MFPDSLLANLAFFAIAQCAVVGYMVTGRIQRGLLLLFGSWILADAALVLRFVLGDPGTLYRVSLLGMQFWGLTELVMFTWGRWRRSRPDVRERRDEDLRRGKVHYLRDELDDALRVFRSLLRRDPWDLVACIGVCQVQVRRGRHSAARRLLGRARRLDLDGHYAGVLELERHRLARRGTSTKREKAESAPASAPKTGRGAARKGSAEPAAPSGSAAAERVARVSAQSAGSRTGGPTTGVTMGPPPQRGAPATETPRPAPKGGAAKPEA